MQCNIQCCAEKGKGNENSCENQISLYTSKVNIFRSIHKEKKLCVNNMTYSSKRVIGHFPLTTSAHHRKIHEHLPKGKVQTIDYFLILC